MKSGLFNRSLADRGTRISGVPAAHQTVGHDAPPLSPVVPSLTGEKTVLPSLLPGSTVALSRPAMIMVRAVAAYERCDNAAAVTIALADYCNKIGAGPLARAALDAAQAAPKRAAPVAIPFVDDDGEDIADVPAFVRLGENRFRNGGP